MDIASSCQPVAPASCASSRKKMKHAWTLQSWNQEKNLPKKASSSSPIAGSWPMSQLQNRTVIQLKHTCHTYIKSRFLFRFRSRPWIADLNSVYMPNRKWEMHESKPHCTWCITKCFQQTVSTFVEFTCLRFRRPTMADVQTGQAIPFPQADHPRAPPTHEGMERKGKGKHRITRILPCRVSLKSPAGQP